MRGRRAAVVAAVSLVIGVEAVAQNSADKAKPVGPTPVYDVSTIKLNDTGSGSVSISINDGTLRMTNVSIKTMLDYGFGIKQNLISGLPGWAQSVHYDVSAKVTDADPSTLKDLTLEQRRAMMRQLLIERFHLKTHIEAKALPVYDLVIAKSGILFKPSVVVEGNAGDKESMGIHNQDMTATQCPIGSLANMLADQVERKVIDKTGLTGHYDLHLKWQREDAPHADNGADELPNIFIAVQEQLGLKLEADKGPVDTLVIDSIEKPEDN